MKLIVDGGSTKTTWAIGDGRGNILTLVETEGINPQFVSEEKLASLLETVRRELGKAGAVSRVEYYGAGCIDAAKNRELAALLGLGLGVTDVCVESDLMGAARALFGTGRGIACIMGTGSNSAYYDGRSLTPGAYAGGFILGDEGSGAVLGRRLLSDWIKRCMPEDIHRSLEERYGLTYAGIVERVYRGEYPNRYLAGFARFIHEMKEEDYIKHLIDSEFDAFFTRNITHYDRTLAVGFVGSVAYHFADDLNEAAGRAGYTINRILKSPIDCLI